jgi:hypothetical protein
MDLSKDPFSLVRGSRHRIAVGNVELNRMNGLSGGQQSRCLRQMIGPDVGNDDSHAGPNERTCHAEADAAASSRNECDLTFDVLH